MSFPEVLLWRELRKKPNGLRFRRQHPADPYTLDFYCAAARLAIEVDGEAHSRGDRPQRDEVRDRWLADRDIRVLRIRAEDVLKNLDGVLQHILAAVGARGEAPSTTRQAARGPLPPLREGGLVTPRASFVPGGRAQAHSARASRTNRSAPGRRVDRSR
ncbi:endonuclease domain-containing protein [Sphingomonas sp. UYAg733]